MNDLSTSPNPPSSSAREANQKDAGNSQVLLPKTLVQQIKDSLKQLKQDTGADYSLVHFMSRVLEKHWMVEMEHLRKGLEKLRWNKG